MLPSLPPGRLVAMLPLQGRQRRASAILRRSVYSAEQCPTTRRGAGIREPRPRTCNDAEPVIHDSPSETMPRDRLRELQAERLARARALRLRAGRALPRSGSTRRGSDPDEVRSLDDLRRLPFTRKSDLRDHYPFGLFAVPRAEVARIHGSSGTTGKPTVVGYTRADVELFAEVNARTLAMAGAEPGMMLHNAFGYGLFTGGLGLHYGAERLGMTVVPVSGGMTERQLLLITDFRPDVIACTPGYALTLAQEFESRGVGPDEISLRFAIVGAEPWTEAMRAEIDRGLGVRSCNIYGLSEVIGPGVSCECVEERNGAPRQRGPLPPRGRRSRERRAAARGRGGRARLHHSHEAGAAARPLLDGRSRQPLVGSLRVRPDARPDERDPWPHRRHADHPGRQRLPDPGRGGARPVRRALSPLPAGRQPRRSAGRARGARGGDRGVLPLGRSRAPLGRGDRSRPRPARAARAGLRPDQGQRSAAR